MSSNKHIDKIDYRPLTTDDNMQLLGDNIIFVWDEQCSIDNIIVYPPDTIMIDNTKQYEIYIKEIK